jgi:hypothetical protein
MRGGQEEQDCLQGLQAEEVPHGRHVQVWLQVRINLHNHLLLNIIIFNSWLIPRDFDMKNLSNYRQKQT